MKKKCKNKEGWTDMIRLKYLVVLIKKISVFDFEMY